MIRVKEHEPHAPEGALPDRREGTRLLVLWICWLVLALFLCLVGVVVC